MKKTTGAASEAAFIAKNIRAGEVSRLRMNLSETAQSINASKATPAIDPINAFRNHEGGSANTDPTAARMAHGKTSRKNLWDRKWNRIRFLDVNNSGTRATTWHRPARFRNRRLDSVPGIAG